LGSQTVNICDCRAVRWATCSIQSESYPWVYCRSLKRLNVSLLRKPMRNVAVAPNRDIDLSSDMCKRAFSWSQWAACFFPTRERVQTMAENLTTRMRQHTRRRGRPSHSSSPEGNLCISRQHQGREIYEMLPRWVNSNVQQVKHRVKLFKNYSSFHRKTVLRRSIYGTGNKRYGVSILKKEKANDSGKP